MTAWTMTGAECAACKDFDDQLVRCSCGGVMYAPLRGEDGYYRFKCMAVDCGRTYTQAEMGLQEVTRWGAHPGRRWITSGPTITEAVVLHWEADHTALIALADGTTKSVHGVQVHMTLEAAQEDVTRWIAKRGHADAATAEQTQPAPRPTPAKAFVPPKRAEEAERKQRAHQAAPKIHEALSNIGQAARQQRAQG